MTEIELRSIDEDDQREDAQILDETDDNILVMFPDGTTNNIPLSARNRLMFRHNLLGFFQGEEILSITETDENGVESRITIVPLDRGFQLKFPWDELRIMPSDVPDLVSALLKFYERDFEKTPLLDLQDEILGDRVRVGVIQALEGMTPYKELIEEGTIEPNEDGWKINDKLMLSWDSEFRTLSDTYTRDGSIVPAESAQQAFNLTTSEAERVSIEIDGKATRLSDKEMDFLTRVMWVLTEI